MAKTFRRRENWSKMRCNMNLINEATYNIGYEAKKSQNLLMPGKFEQNVLRKINLINVATDNIGHELTK